MLFTIVDSEIMARAKRWQGGGDGGKLKMRNEFIANKITLKCVNKNGKFHFLLSTPHCYSSSSLSSRTQHQPSAILLFFTSSLSRLAALQYCVIVKVNILRYQGEFFSRLTHCTGEKSFSAILQKRNGKDGYGITNQDPSPHALSLTA